MRDTLRIWAAMLAFAGLVLVDVVAKDQPLTPYDLLRASTADYGDGCWKLTGKRVGGEETIREMVFEKCE